MLNERLRMKSRKDHKLSLSSLPVPVIRTTPPSFIDSFMAILLRKPPSRQSLFPSSQPSNRWAHNHHPTLVRVPFPRTFPCASSSPPPPPPVVEIEEDSPSPPLDESSDEDEPAIGTVDNLQTRGCQTCGREEIERGCNGEGRIQGGIGAVPGFGWWPIKAYRPCPGFIASGGRYRRRGQNMDEVAFGREKEDTMEKVESRKRKPSPRKFRR